jgi:hypothetical protein
VGDGMPLSPAKVCLADNPTGSKIQAVALTPSVWRRETATNRQLSIGKIETICFSRILKPYIKRALECPA